MARSALNGVIDIVDRASRIAAEAEATTRDRCRGAMLGLAVGNALGLPVEFRDAREISLDHPAGVREIDPNELLHPWDDDLAQAALLAEAMSEGDGRMSSEDLAPRFTRWFDTNARGIGNLTYRVIEAWKRGVAPSEASRLAWEKAHPFAAGNGAIMRCAPVALRWGLDGRALVEQTAVSCLVTHFDPRCVISCIAFNAGLALALCGAMVDLSKLARAVPPEMHEDGQAAEAILAAAVQAPEEMALDRDPGTGYTLLAMKVGLWALTQAQDLEESLVRVVSLGGDTDTNGAVAGAALGARFGASAIPGRWTARLREPGRIVELADRLCDARLAEGKK